MHGTEHGREAALQRGRDNRLSMVERKVIASSVHSPSAASRIDSGIHIRTGVSAFEQNARADFLDDELAGADLIQDVHPVFSRVVWGGLCSHSLDRRRLEFSGLFTWADWLRLREPAMESGTCDPQSRREIKPGPRSNRLTCPSGSQVRGR